MKPIQPDSIGPHRRSFLRATLAGMAGAPLLAVHGCLGGVWTAGLLTWIFGFNKPGLTSELSRELAARGARRGTHPGREAWNAPVFIDATGDGDLGALADCQWKEVTPGLTGRLEK